MILVYDKDNSEEQKYRFGSLYAYDSFEPGTDEATDFEHLTFDCHYELEELGASRYRITAVVSEEWLNHPETIYPVTIDPTLTGTPSNLDDTYIRESSPNSNYYLESRLRIGNYNGTNYTSGICYSFLKFKNMPSLSNVAVTNATLNMDLLTGQSTAQQAKAWRVTSSWTSSGLKWSNRPSYTEDAAAVANPNGLVDYSFQVADIVDKWYNGGTNYGFMLGYSNQSVHDLNSLYSSDCGISTHYPTLTFDYVSAPTLSSVANGVYYIRNQNSGKYIDVSGQYASNDTNIHQWSFHSDPCQQWQITGVGGGWYTIRPQHATGMAMGVQNGSTADGADIRQYTYNGSDSQKFGFIKLSNGAYRIVTKVTNGLKGLSVNGRYTYDGANIHQYWYNSDYTNDHWFLEEAGKIDTGLKSKVNMVIIPETGLTTFTSDYRFTQVYAQIDWNTRKLGRRTYYATTKTSRRPDEINSSLYAFVHFVKSDDSTAFDVTWEDGLVYLPADVIHWEYKVSTDIITVSYPVTAKFQFTEMENSQLPYVLFTENIIVN